MRVFFILYKSWVMIIFFSFEVRLKCLFLLFENALKKLRSFYFFSLIQINIFDIFILF